MSVVINVADVGQVGVAPRKVKMVSTDNLAAVTTAGYLNSSNLQGFNFLPTDTIDCIYSYNPATNSGTYVLLTVALSAGVYTLSAPAIVLGNVIAGANGAAGSFTSYPAALNNGTLVYAAANNSAGNFSTTVSNAASVGQSQVISIPDVGAATGQFLAKTAAFVSGNLPQASGTAGLMVDSGIVASTVVTAVAGGLKQVSVTLNPTQMAAAYATPIQLIANPLASQMILVLAANVYTASTGNTPYATGTAPIIQYSSGTTNGAHGLGTIATAAGLVAGDITAATSQVRNLFQFATGAQTGLSGLGIYFSNATGGYTAGTGTNVTFTLLYQVLTATV